VLTQVKTIFLAKVAMSRVAQLCITTDSMIKLYVADHGIGALLLMFTSDK